MNSYVRIFISFQTNEYIQTNKTDHKDLGVKYSNKISRLALYFKLLEMRCMIHVRGKQKTAQHSIFLALIFAYFKVKWLLHPNGMFDV